jgi:protein gp37
MAEITNIPWTDHTWNSWTGCQKVSPGCKNCYMFAGQRRGGRDPTEIKRTTTWKDPPHWQKELAALGLAELVFTCSWSDWFIAEADDWRPEAWKVIRACPNLEFQILTKRPERIADHLPADWGQGYPNVWLGVSIENNDYVGRADVLRQVPAAVRFISAEPLLGPLPDLDLAGIHWLICGGESGPNFRPMNHTWAMDLRDRCKASGVAFFFKQSAAIHSETGIVLAGQIIKEFPPSATGIPAGGVRITSMQSSSMQKTNLAQLHTLETEIESHLAKSVEEFCLVGIKLKRIRDDLLYREAGFDTFEKYCNQRFELSKQRVYQLITAAEYRQHLPESTIGRLRWNEREIRELTRIPDKQDAARVAKKILDQVENDPGQKLTSAYVRKVVDHELGTGPDPTKAESSQPQAKEEKRLSLQAAKDKLQRMVSDLAQFKEWDWPESHRDRFWFDLLGFLGLCIPECREHCRAAENAGIEIIELKAKLMAMQLEQQTEDRFDRLRGHPKTLTACRRKLSMKYHPDRGGSPHDMAIVNEVFDAIEQAQKAEKCGV